MHVTDLLNKVDSLLGQSVLVSGHLTIVLPALQGPWYIRPTKESQLFEDAIQIDLTDMKREEDDIAAGIMEPPSNRILTNWLLGVPALDRGFSLDPPDTREIGSVEIAGRLAPPLDPVFAASLTDITSIVVLRPNHVFRFRQGIELSEFLAPDVVSVTDVLAEHIELKQRRVRIAGILARTGDITYLAPDRPTMSDRSRCIFLDPAIDASPISFLLLIVGEVFSYNYDAQVVGRLAHEAPEPFPAQLIEIDDITLQFDPFCVFSWYPMMENTSSV